MALLYSTDTVGNFSIKRLLQLCKEQDIIERFFVLQALTLEEIYEALELVKRSEPSFSLSVIDTVSAPFRILKTDSIAERVDAIKKFGLTLRRIDPNQEAVFLYINQMTTRFLYDDRPILVPALGESWTIMSDLQIKLNRLKKKSENQCGSLLVTRSDYRNFERLELLYTISVRHNHVVSKSLISTAGHFRNQV